MRRSAFIMISYESSTRKRFYGLAFSGQSFENSLTCKIDGQMKCVARQRDRGIGSAAFGGKSRVFRLCGAHGTVNCKERGSERGGV